MFRRFRKQFKKKGVPFIIEKNDLGLEVKSDIVELELDLGNQEQ